MNPRGTGADWGRIAAIFEEVVDLDRASRDRALESLCAGDAARIAAVRELLEEHDRAARSSFLASPAHGESPAADPLIAGLEGARLGDFSLVRRIGQGGMGMVFEAEQQNPRRRVAVKLLKPAFASGAALRRFVVEAEILARLRHPGIAQVYASGTHRFESGPLGFELPWYAMELLVDADDLVRHAAKRGLPSEERLRLFGAVCEAVHHAHRRGVIHRDLKPANVLVDGSGAPKVIDFGIARAVDGEDGASARITLATRAGDLLGTLRYMAPEQVDGRADQVDVRTDVYALGVVLFELMTGETPLPIDGATLDEAMRRIREEFPRRLRQLSPELPKELEWIVGRCLEKAPDRRYPSVAELARDIERFADHEPLAAGPPDWSYRVATHLRRHRIAWSAAALLLAILAGWIVSLRRTLDRALDAEASERRAAAIARGEAQKVQDVLGVIEYSIAKAGGGRTAASVPLVDVLTEIESSIGSHPRSAEVTAAIEIELADFQLKLGDPEKAGSLLAAAIARLEADGLGDGHDARYARLMQGRVSAARGDLHEAERRLAQAEAARRTEEDPPSMDLATAHERIALLASQGRYAEAEPIAREFLRRFSDPGSDPGANLPVFQNSLAQILTSLGRYQEAERHARDAIAGEETHHARAPARAANARNTLAVVLVEDGRADSALELISTALPTLERELGAEHRMTLSARTTLARARLARGEGDAAREIAEDLVARRVAAQGAEHADLVAARTLLGRIYLGLDRLDDAERELSLAVELARKVLREGHPGHAFALAVLGRVKAARGAVAEGREFLETARRELRATFSEDHPRVAEIAGWLVR